MRPRLLRINGQDWKVRALRRSSDHLGETHADKGLIQIRGNQSLYSQQDTLLHEVMHAIRHAQGYEYGEEVEEGYVRSLATGLLGVLHDNPKLADWLLMK